MPDRLLVFATATVLTVSTIYGYWKLKKRQSNNDSANALNSLENKDKAENVLQEIKKFQKVSTENFPRLSIRNEKQLLKKIARMFEDGLDLLQIITDFDRTLSKSHSMGRKIPSSHGILENYPELTEETKEKFRHLRDTYMPIEVNPQMTEEEKLPYMEEWWNQSHGELIRAGLKRHLLSETVSSAGIVLRDGVPDFLALSHKLAVPVLIFSAGIGNVVEEVIDQLNCSFSNMQVASNYMRFDNQGEVTGFQSDFLIHIFNKAASACMQSEFCVNNLKRRNVILLGDSTGDRKMADGAVEPAADANVIRIGFLNSHIKDSMETYMQHYDVVLVDDQTFDVPNVLLSQLGRTA